MKHLVLSLGLTVSAFGLSGCTTPGGSPPTKPGVAAAPPAAARSNSPASSFKETAKAEKENKGNITPYPFTTCAVIRKELEGGPRYRRVYKNQEVIFCCTPCLKAFDTNPDPYMPRIIAAAAAKARGETVNSGW